MKNQESHKEIDGRLDLKALPLTMCLYMLMVGILASWIVSWILPVAIGRAWGFLGIVMVAGAYLNIKWCFRLFVAAETNTNTCLLYTSPSPRDGLLSRMPSSA